MSSQYLFRGDTVTEGGGWCSHNAGIRPLQILLSTQGLTRDVQSFKTEIPCLSSPFRRSGTENYP